MDFCLNKLSTLYEQHHNLGPNISVLKRKMEELNIMKEDIESRMKLELRPQKKLKRQVEHWFGNVGRANSEVENLDVGASNFFSSGLSAEKVLRIKDDIEDIIQKGSFSDGLVIDDPLESKLLWDMTGLMGEAIEQNLNNVWELLIDDKVERIGVHGMGGVGKTTIMKQINNRLLKEANKFVIWIAVSKEIDIVKLQTRIAKKFGQDLSEDDETLRAQELFGIMAAKRSYVLILDDLWDKISLEEVGIPKPSINGSKIVITSRSRDVLQYLDCTEIRVKPLQQEMAWKLFLEKVGKNILNYQDLIPIVKMVAKECGGLPLAIVVVARSLRGTYEIQEWRNALNELRGCLESINSIDGDIFAKLQFSYDHLKSVNIQNCFLSCALYPEDFSIDREELITYWIGGGLVEEMERRKDEVDRANTIINMLINNCLLEAGSHEDEVKMYDLVRDMAMRITSMRPKFLVKAGMQLKEVPHEQVWPEDVEKVSLMKNGIFEIPSIVSSPRCHVLTTLLLQHNDICWIPDCLFKHMPAIMVLDLSRNPIEVLPDSISNLKNLTTLRLQRCYNLEKVPCLLNLKSLKQLDLSGTNIKEVPKGMEELANLKCLDMRVWSCLLIPEGKLERLTSLQHLYMGDIAVSKEIANLKSLEYFEGRFCDVCDLNAVAESLNSRKELLTKYYITVGYGELLKTNSSKAITLQEVDLCGGLIHLPFDVQHLEIGDVGGGMRSLNKSISITSLTNATDLRELDIINCGEMECVFSAWCPQINNILILSLCNLDELNALFGFVGESTGMLSSLKVIWIHNCNRIKKLFSSGCTFHNLEEILISRCEQLEEIVTWEEQGMVSDSNTTPLISLPKLKKLELKDLPQLKSICAGSALMLCDSLQQIKVENYPSLKRIPLFLSPLHGCQPSPPHSLKTIYMHPIQLWDSVEWNHPNAIDVLRPFLKCLEVQERCLWDWETVEKKCPS